MTDRTAGVVRADEAQVLFDGPLGAFLLAGGDATAGTVSFVVHPLRPRALGSPVHTHRREDEWSYVLEGEVGVELAGEVVVARPGDLVLKPRDVPHAFWNAGDAPRACSRSSRRAASSTSSPASDGSRRTASRATWTPSPGSAPSTSWRWTWARWSGSRPRTACGWSEAGQPPASTSSASTIV
jgi:mannose-6-phosphate isomerase-like protein (cupin superfamily)